MVKLYGSAFFSFIFIDSNDFTTHKPITCKKYQPAAILCVQNPLVQRLQTKHQPTEENNTYYLPQKNH